MKKALFMLILITAFVLSAKEYQFAGQFGGISSAAKIYGNYGYFSSGGNIFVLGLSNPDNVTEINRFYTGSFFTKDIQIKDNLLIIASSPAVYIYSLDDPVRPNLITTIDRYVGKILFKDSLLLLASDQYIYIYDIVSPAYPVYKSYITFQFNDNMAYAVKNSLLYGFTQYGYSGPQYINGFDISDPANPVLAVQKMISSNWMGKTPKKIEIVHGKLLAAINDSLKIFNINQPDSLAYSGSFPVPANLSTFKAVDNKMYIAYNNLGVSELNISDLYHPQQIRTYNWNTKIDDFDVTANQMLIAAEENGSKAVKIQNNGFTANYCYQQSAIANDISFDSQYAYTSGYYSGFQIWDTSDSTNHIKLGQLNLNKPRKVLRQGDFVFHLSDYDSTINIINTSDKINPFICKQLASAYIGDYCIDDNRLFILVRDGINVYNISNPANPLFVTCISRHDAGRMAVKNNLLFLVKGTDYPFTTDLEMYDIANLANITLKSQMRIGEGPEYFGDCKIMLDLPKVLLGCTSGLVSCLINSANQLELCDNTITPNTHNHFYSYYYSHDNVYADLYPSGLNIFDAKDPWNVFVAKTIDIDAQCIYRNGNTLAVAIGSGGYVFYNIVDSVGIADNQPMVKNPYLLTNYPNPFNPATTVKFTLPQTGDVKLEVYNLKGELTKTLIRAAIPQGEHSILWNGDSNSGATVGSGTYFLKLSVNGTPVEMKKCLLVK